MCLQRGREGIGPTAGPSQLWLILFCQERLAGLPLTAHEWWSGDWGVGGRKCGPTRHWLHHARAVQRYRWKRHRTTSNPSRHVCLLALSQGKTHTPALFLLVIGGGCSHVLLADTPITYNRCVTAQRCSRAPPTPRGVQGGFTESWSHAGSLGLCTCRFHVCLPSPTAEILLLFTLTSAPHTFDLLPDERVIRS